MKLTIEEIALEAMKGLLSSPIIGPHRVPHNLSREAVAYAKALIEALDEAAIKANDVAAAEKGERP